METVGYVIGSIIKELVGGQLDYTYSVFYLMV